RDAKGLHFLYVQIQLWIRELSRVQYTLEENPKFSFPDQVESKKNTSALPPWYCRECNSSGWLGVKADNREVFSRDTKEIYEKYFNNNKNVYFLLPEGELSPEDREATGYRPDDILKVKLDPNTLRIVDDTEDGVGVQAYRKLKNNKSQHYCPCCNSENTVAIVGTKIPTLSSIS